ncbi:BA14K family protein [Rhizobium sp. LjRoot30]|uniref:BA14K family protein n=1 Tax=Rhizobium sp. LjRoot30 TaxID=3342320 RepID=UPI003ECDE8F0
MTMSIFRKLITACAVSLTALLPLPAGAAPMGLPSPVLDRQSDVSEARVICGYYGCRRVWRPHYGHRHYHRPRYYSRDYYRPRHGYNRHVRWCLNRYQSYNPATNRFLTYGGAYRICRSPWG